MTAPRTDLEKQRRWHFGPLWGMTLVTVFAVALIVYWVFESVGEADPSPPPSAMPQESVPLPAPPVKPLPQPQ